MEKFMNLKKELVMIVGYDGDMESPRKWDNLGTFYTWERNYMSPDENKFSNGVDFIASILGDKVTEKIHDKYNNTADFMNEVIPKMDRKGYVLYPVSKYEHGGVVFSLGCSDGWDTGTVGVIFVEKKKIYEEFGVKRITKEIREKVESILSAELKTYTQWSNGEVYDFVLEDLQGDFIDSCGGIYDDIMYSVESAYLYTKDFVELGELSDWEVYDESKMLETFEIKTVVTRR